MPSRKKNIEKLSESFTRTKETETEYLKRAEELIRRYKKAYPGRDVSIDEWLRRTGTVLASASFRVYKAALAHYFETRNDPEQARRIRELTHFASVPQEQGQSDPKRTSKSSMTSALKQKFVSIKDEKELKAEALKHGKERHWNVRAYHWLQATLLTGLRPREWKTAVLAKSKNGQPVLVVINAKNTNMRSHGMRRTLDLRNLRENELELLRKHLRWLDPKHKHGLVNARGEKITFESYFEGARTALLRMNRRLHPKRKRHPSLYSARHQFIADLKLAEYSRAEIAALVGHANDVTATEHYGRKRSGRGRSGLPIPNPSEVKKIRRTYKGFDRDESPTRNITKNAAPSGI